ncbi:MAG TPA: hypothetical protein VLC98_14930 [Phnomibacter sp.]|nr:hypothetical protein [Phnomibacter sp.]
MLTLYKILSFILLPIAAILAAFTAIGLLMALANPAALLPLFMMACSVIYVFTSFSFLQKAIMGNRPVKAKLRDWIRVNAFVAIFVAVLNLTNGIILFTNTAMLKEAGEQAMATIKQMNTPFPYDIIKTMKAVLLFMIAFGAVMVTHILFTFRFIKKYRDYFSL